MSIAPEELTAEEKAAVAALRRLAKKWPDSLWLFAASGNLHIMKNDESGQRAITHLGGVDPELTVAHIEIPCDGGDW